MSRSGLILEGLNMRRAICESYEDLPTCHKSRELQKILSDAFSRKYFLTLKEIGVESIGVEVYTHEDSDVESVIRIPDVIYEITLYIAFDIRATVDIKSAERVISSTLKRYPKFRYEKVSKQFYYTAETPDDIFDVLSLLKADGANYAKLVSVKSAKDIESEVERQRAEWRKEKEDQDRDYRRDVLGSN